MNVLDAAILKLFLQKSQGGALGAYVYLNGIRNTTFNVMKKTFATFCNCFLKSAGRGFLGVNSIFELYGFFHKEILKSFFQKY